MSAQEQNYKVSYEIDVKASEGARQIQAFAESVSKLIVAKNKIKPIAEEIRKMMEGVEDVFRKNGRKRDHTYTLDIKTNETEKKLEKVKTLLGEINSLTKDIKLVINPGKPIDTKAVRTNAKKVIDKKSQEAQKAISKETANATVHNFREAQKQITQSIGKVNSALISLERGRTIHVDTVTAKNRLNEVLTLIQKIKSGAKGIKLQITGGIQAKGRNLIVDGSIQPYRIPENLRRKAQQRSSTAISKQRERENARIRQEEEKAQKRKQQEENKRKLEEDKKQQRNAAQLIRDSQKKVSSTERMNNSRQRAAINRLQYSKAPSFRNMPFTYMLNGYMAYGLMRKEFNEALEYSNIMQSAHSILRVADTDLGTFDTRFSQMAKNVRQIGIETKFTAIEVAGAVKFLSMAGMDIDSINKTIRPITNLALIGDNDISQIADLTTNIMAGYDIKNDSMNSVADIISSTISRSNVNILEMAESYKMAAGYLKLSGVEFSESAAAIGILGNMGMKGTLSGTALRGMSSRFAKQPKEGKATLKKLGINFTEEIDVYGNQVEKLRPLSDIFQDLKTKGASVQDMNAIFGRTAANAAMILMNNHEKLRDLSVQNRASYGISQELALVKQNTTKGLIAQVQSQFSEAFMQGFEVLEPKLRSVLRDFLEKFSTKEFAKGLTTIGSAILDILSVLGKIATWVIKNFSWIEPLLFSGLVATKLFKLAGALTNVGVALGFIGKQSIGSSALQGISGLLGGANLKGLGALSIANKRSIVTALNAAGMTGAGKAGMIRSLVSSAGVSGTVRGALPGLFATQVSTSNGLLGAGSSIAALGTGALAATAGISALIGAVGFLAYKTWKVKEAKDAILEDIESNKKYRYPSIENLYESLRKAHTEAVNTKLAVDELSNKSIEEEGGPIGAFSGNWWTSILTTMGNALNSHQSHGGSMQTQKSYSIADAYQDDVKTALYNIAEKDGQKLINSAYSDFTKISDTLQLRAFIENIDVSYGVDSTKFDKSMYTKNNGVVRYNKGIADSTAVKASQTPDYAATIQTQIIPKIKVGAEAYYKMISSRKNAMEVLALVGVKEDELKAGGYYRDNAGIWKQKPLAKNASDDDKINRHKAVLQIQQTLVRAVGLVRDQVGGSAEGAANIMQAAGFGKHMYSNEPMYNDPEPFNKNRITNPTGLDDGGSGGNYSGTGKLSSAAPKQVIVNITNLLSVGTIDLMKSKEGKEVEIQELKEQMAQALIDVVHDFDASWNG